MQDIHCVGGGRLLAEGGGDLRLQPLHHQALNCPRCDSLNTKFCYYNNYNLSQPRHYCKSCRRYWTKGGILRNVPVGGGCRKPKRAKPKSTESAISSAPEQERKFQVIQRKADSRSGSEGSSLTAANSSIEAAINAGNWSAGGAVETMDSLSDGNGNPNSALGAGSLEQGSDCGLFSEIGDFSSLISASTSNETLSFGFGNQQGLDQVQEWQNQNPTINQEMVDQTVHSRSGGGDFGSLDWPGNGNQGLFDFSNAVDHTYWNQHQWTDQDQSSLYNNLP